MQSLRFALIFLTLFICAATALPFLKTDQWWIRVFDFPRLQLFVLGIAILVVYAFIFRLSHTLDKGLIGVLTIALMVQAWQIFPYTPLAPRQVKAAKNDQNALTIFVANVLQENRNTAELIEQIKEIDPEIILLNETDNWWTEQLRVLEKSHPHTLLHPRTNTYGMNLYSKVELIDPEVRFLVEPEIPSIRVKLKMRNQRVIHFYGVHPRPPALERPELDERQDSTQRDAELIVIGKEVSRISAPVIVAGDFNDVAWSHTTRLFQRTSRLLDPRVGRGLYNSYSAKIPIFRYPLDHLFHSDHFTLLQMERLKYFGSDHFPIMVKLNLEPEAAMEQEAPPEKPADTKEAEEILQRPQEQIR